MEILTGVDKFIGCELRINRIYEQIAAFVDSVDS
jgi:hypothetical protein